MALIDFSNLTTEIVAGLVVAAIAGIGGLLYAWRRKQEKHSSLRSEPALVEKAKPIDIEKLIVKRVFHVSIPRSQVVSELAKVLEPSSMIHFNNPTENAAEFRRNMPHFMRKYDSAKYYELTRKYPDPDEFAREAMKKHQFRETFPTTLRVRVLREVNGVSY